MLLLAVLLQVSASPAAAPRDLVARAVSAMGGEQSLRGLKTLTLSFYSMGFGIGQEETPESPARATVTTATQTVDYAGSRQLVTAEVRTVAGQVNRLRRVTAGGIGLVENNGTPAPDAPGSIVNVERGWRRAPERLLITALDNPATLSRLPARTWRGEPVDGLRYRNGPDTLNLYFDRRSGLMVLTETIADDPILGDRRTQTAFTRWQDAGGVLIPRQIDVDANGRLQTHTVVTSATTNSAVPDSVWTIPDSIAARAQRPSATPTPPPVTVSLVELAPNVWRAEGGSHHTLVVDQGARLVLVEAPLSAARMQAVLDTLRSRFPNKPVGLAINTHHHWDHSGGLRTVMAAGIPIVTHARNASFVRSIATARKTVQPDALSRRTRPQRVAITTVEDTLTIGSGDGRIVLYRLPTAHVEGILAAYVPAAKILFQSDVVNAAPTPPPAGSAELVRFVKERGIAVERVAGGHGVVLQWADVERAAAGAAAP